MPGMFAVQSDERLIAQLCEHQPEAVEWFLPVMDATSSDEKTVDFEVYYCNLACCHKTGLTKEEIIGKRVLADGFPDPTIKNLKFEQCLQVMETGTPTEYSYFSTYYNRYFTLSRVKVSGGVLVTSRDRTEEYMVNQERQQQEIEKQQQLREFSDILNTSADGIITLKSIRDTEGNLVDFRIIQCNTAGSKIGRLPVNCIDRTLLEVLSRPGDYGYFELYKQVVETGVPFSAELPFNPAEAEEGWYKVSLTKLDDGLVSNFVDITKIKQLEQQARHNANELQAIFDASMGCAYSAQAIRDQKGNVTDLRFLRVNQNFFKMFGVSEEQVIDKLLLSISPQTQKTGFLNDVQVVLDHGHSKNRELYYDHNSKWFEFCMVRLDKEQVAVTVNDITVKKQRIMEIERQKSLLDNILKHSSSGISVTEVIRNSEGKVVDGRTILANNAAVKYTGLSKELYLSKTALELDPNIVTSSYFHKCIETLNTGEPFLIQYFLEQTQRWLEVSVSKMDDDHLIHIFTDVTIVKEAQLEMEKSVEALRLSNKNLEEFAYAASHDLKEPIRKVHFFATQLQDRLKDKLNTEELRLFQRLENSTERMRLLIDDLLEYSHAGKDESLLEKVDLNQKIHKVLLDLELMITEKDATVNVGKLPTIKGYRRQIQQLFQNLVGNALKYNKPGVSPIVTITSRLLTGRESGFNLPEKKIDTQYHLIEISDNGIGFEQKDADRIFNIFTRLHGNKEYTGSGVGLSIVKRVVENHGGCIEALGEPDKGATFRVLLPAE